jgi:hypothetical protein
MRCGFQWPCDQNRGGGTWRAGPGRHATARDLTAKITIVQPDKLALCGSQIIYL